MNIEREVERIAEDHVRQLHGAQAIGLDSPEVVKNLFMSAALAGMKANNDSTLEAIGAGT